MEHWPIKVFKRVRLVATPNLNSFFQFAVPGHVLGPNFCCQMTIGTCTRTRTSTDK